MAPKRYTESQPNPVTCDTPSFGSRVLVKTRASWDRVVLDPRTGTHRLRQTHRENNM